MSAALREQRHLCEQRSSMRANRLAAFAQRMYCSVRKIRHRKSISWGFPAIRWTSFYGRHWWALGVTVNFPQTLCG